METNAVLLQARELTITKLVNAPRKLVWEVWTNPDHIKNWWGPNGFTNTISKMEVKPGGVWDFIMHGPDGTNYKNKSIYKEVRKYERLVYDHVSPNFQFTVTFSEKENKTLIAIQMLFETAEERDKVVKAFKADVGLKENMYKLEGYLRKVSAEKEMTLTRTINAPREMVFKAWTDPEQLKKWWGPKGFTNPVCDVESRPGGSILIHMTAPDGIVYPMDGVFHEIIEPRKIVFTTAALDKNGNRLFEVLNTVTFDEDNGKTKLNLHTAVSNITEEGKPYISGMNEGWNQSIDRLEELALSKNAPVILERVFNAPVEKVWRALTDVGQMRIWYFPQLEEFKPEVGFETQFNVHHDGRDWLHVWKITEVVLLEKIVLAWTFGGYPGQSCLSFDLVPIGNKTKLVLTHEGLETFMPEQNPGLAKENFVEGWTQFMDKALKEFLQE